MGRGRWQKSEATGVFRLLGVSAGGCFHELGAERFGGVSEGAEANGFE